MPLYPSLDHVGVIARIVADAGSLMEAIADTAEREVLLLRNTRPFNVRGLPAISLPCGFTSGGLPIGLQIAGPPGREDRVLALAGAYEQATDR